jgi:hypothetical protein
MAESLTPAAGGAAAEGGDICGREHATDIPAAGAPQAPTLRPYQVDTLRRIADVDQMLGGGLRAIEAAP